MSILIAPLWMISCVFQLNRITNLFFNHCITVSNRCEGLFDYIFNFFQEFQKGLCVGRGIQNRWGCTCIKKWCTCIEKWCIFISTLNLLNH